MSSRTYIREPAVVAEASVALAMVALVVLSVTLPSVVAGQAIMPTLESGFANYLRNRGIDSSSLYEEDATVLFRAFLTEEPQYERSIVERAQISVPNRIRAHDVASVGHIIESFETVINGATYTVELREGKLLDGSSFIKVLFAGPEGINDPWFYVTRSYVWVRVCIGFCFWVIAGEDYWLYTDFATNVEGVNEAAIFRARFNEWTIYSTLVSSLIGLVAGILSGGWGSIGGIVGGYQAQWANFVVGTAYDSQRGISLAIYHRWLYVGRGYVALWAFWHIDNQWHRALPAPGLELLSLLTNIDLSKFFMRIGNTYGWNRWFWGGVYRG